MPENNEERAAWSEEVLASVVATLEDAEKNNATPEEWERQARAALALHRVCQTMSPVEPA